MPINIDKSAGKKNGVSQYRVRLNYTDANGNRRQIERRVWGKAEAEAVLRELEAEFKNKRAVLPAKMTVAELADKYAEYHVSETRQSSHEAVMKELKLRVLPYLQNQKIANLNQAVLAEWKITVDKLSCSLRTKRNAYKALAAMLNYAVKMDFIPKNYLSALGNFKDKGNVIEKPSGKLRYYTDEQFQKYISVMKADCKTVEEWDFYVFFCIAFFTGARKGEIHALKWSDIDGKILHIRRSVTQKLKGGDVETAPKTKSSVRDLQLPEQLIAVLNEHKERQRNAAPSQFNEDYRICGGVRPLRDTSIDKKNRKYAAKAKLPRITIHEFRHSHVSLLANNHILIQEVSRRLGHSTVQETWNTYCHLYPREEERAVEVLNTIHI